MQVLVLTLNQIIAVDDITRDIDCPKNKPENFGALQTKDGVVLHYLQCKKTLSSKLVYTTTHCWATKSIASTTILPPGTLNVNITLWSISAHIDGEGLIPGMHSVLVDATMEL